MVIDTKVIPNFLSDNELDLLEKHILSTDDIYHNYNPGNFGGEVFSGTYYIVRYYEERNKLVRDILQPKLEEFLHPDLKIQQIHIFDCFDPYNVHSDIDSGGPLLPDAPNHAWTLIIPLFDVDSHTIVFKEGNQIKQPIHYFKDVEPYPEMTIDMETYKKYFTHVPIDFFRYLTIENIFPWRRGSLFAADRFKFHTSDNFIANGVKNKKAIIAWTSLPNR
jgi:hypothetical protein